MRSVLVVCSVVGLARSAHAGPAFTTDVFELADQVINLAIDVPTATHVVLRAEIAADIRNDSVVDGDYHGGRQAAVAGRVFFQRALEGPFVDAEIRARDFNVSGSFGDVLGMTEYNDHYRAWSPRLLAGYQHVAHDHVTAAAAVGIGYEWITRDDGDESKSDVVYIASIRLGYAF